MCIVCITIYIKDKNSICNLKIEMRSKDTENTADVDDMEDNLVDINSIYEWLLNYYAMHNILTA